MRSVRSDELRVDDLAVYTKIGFAEDERSIGQFLVFGICAYLDHAQVGVSDELTDSVSYVDLAICVEGFAQSREFRLIENLAHNLALEILSKFERIQAVGVTVKKPHIPNPAFRGKAAVYAYRERSRPQ